MFHLLDAWEASLARLTSFFPGHETATNCNGKNLLILPTLHAGKLFYSNFKRNLENQGFQVGILSVLRDPVSLDFAVDHIANQIVTAQDNCTLVAHGTGGLYALVLPEFVKKKIRRLITLGTPFQGARCFHLSHFSYWDYKSEWIHQNLRQASSYPLFYPLSSILDYTYLPSDSTSFGQGRDLWLDIPGNFNLVTHEENLRTILEFLGSPKAMDKQKPILPVKTYQIDLSRFQKSEQKPTKKTAAPKKKATPKKKRKT